MKFVAMLVVLVSFSAMAGESNECLEKITIFKDKSETASILAQNSANLQNELAQAKDKKAQCKILADINMYTGSTLSNANEARVALQDSLLVCKDMKLKKEAIKNLDNLYNSALETKEFRTYYNLVYQNMGCDK
jgi:hypothetical protein